MIPTKLRFHGHGSLRYLHRNSRALRSRYFAVKVLSNPRRKSSRFAVIVSKKTHKSAVGRNRIRRRVYEILRLENPKFAGTYDIAIIVTSGEVMSADFVELTEQLTEILKSAGVYSK